MQRIKSYFTNGVVSKTLQTIGVEVETQFVTKSREPITVQMSQQILLNLTDLNWVVSCKKNNLITTLIDSRGNKIFYELGRHNIEIATAPTTTDLVVSLVEDCLSMLYDAASKVGAIPYFEPVLSGEEDLLVIPDKRDMSWVKLDGRKSLATLARTSSVQFTISVGLSDVIKFLNVLGEKVDSFLVDFPQDLIWKKYINDSSAGYLFNRYGGPLLFESIDDYCQLLTCHDVVQGAQLIPVDDVKNLDVDLYLRSVWWHFRLKRYDNDLCIEIRPMARRTDDYIHHQLEKILSILSV